MCNAGCQRQPVPTPGCHDFQHPRKKERKEVVPGGNWKCSIELCARPGCASTTLERHSAPSPDGGAHQGKFEELDFVRKRVIFSEQTLSVRFSVHSLTSWLEIHCRCLQTVQSIQDPHPNSHPLRIHILKLSETHLVPAPTAVHCCSSIGEITSLSVKPATCKSHELMGRVPTFLH